MHSVFAKFFRIKLSWELIGKNRTPFERTADFSPFSRALLGFLVEKQHIQTNLERVGHAYRYYLTRLLALAPMPAPTRRSTRIVFAFLSGFIAAALLLNTFRNRNSQRVEFDASAGSDFQGVFEAGEKGNVDRVQIGRRNPKDVLAVIGVQASPL